MLPPAATITCAIKSAIHPRKTRACACTTVGIVNVPRNSGEKYVGQNPITTMASIQRPSHTWKRERTRGGAIRGLSEVSAVAAAFRLMLLTPNARVHPSDTLSADRRSASPCRNGAVVVSGTA